MLLSFLAGGGGINGLSFNFYVAQLSNFILFSEIVFGSDFFKYSFFWIVCGLPESEKSNIWFIFLLDIRTSFLVWIG